MKNKISGAGLLAGGCLTLLSCNPTQNPERPDIIWIVAEDMSADFSCYGSEEVLTPNIDQLAEESVRFRHSYVTAPVCSPSRSALLTGRYQTSTGAHNHRSSRGEVKIFLPENTKTIPALFSENGYFTANCGYDYNPKTDYNHLTPPDLYDASVRLKADNSNWDELWGKNTDNKPVFLQLQLYGGKNRNYKPENPVDPDEVILPPYYPDTEIFREDHARYLNTVIYTDLMIKNIVEYLKKSGMWDNSLVFFITDHGEDNYRHKQFLYDGGIHIPMFLKKPSGTDYKIKAGEEDLILHIDMAATSLDAAGIQIPDYIEGQSLISENYVPREYVISARDRCDWTPDRIRSVRTREYKYIRNYRSDLSHMQSNYRDHWPTVKEARELYRQGSLDPVQARYFEETRPEEELYYLPDDPHEINNLADDPRHAEILRKLRTTLEDWIRETDDQGQYPESEQSYRESLRNVNTGSTLEGFPLIAGPGFPFPDGPGVSGKFYFSNTSDKPLLITGDLGIITPPTSEIEIGPGSDISLHYHIDSINTQGMDISYQTGYAFNPGEETRFSYHFNLKKPEMYRIGKLNELPIIDGKIQSTMDQAHKTGEILFQVFMSDRYLYIPAIIRDDEINAEKNTPAWEQDGLEVRMDYRNDPFRSNSQGTREFLDHLALIVSPSESGEPAYFYKPAQATMIAAELFEEDGLSYACRQYEDRYEAEFLIPLRFIEDKQGTDWKAVRINVIQHDHDNGEQKRHEWKPQWGSENDYTGSGTFFRNP